MLFYNIFHLSSARDSVIGSRRRPYKLASNEWQYINTELLYNDNNTIQQIVAYIIIGVFVINLLIRTAIDGTVISLSHQGGNNTGMQVQINQQTIQTVYMYMHQISQQLPSFAVTLITSICTIISYITDQLVNPTRSILHATVVTAIAITTLYIIFNMCSEVVNRMRTVMFGLPVYLIDFTTFNAPEHWKVPFDRFRTIAQNFGFKGEELEFCMRVLEKNGLGDDTYFPPGIHLDKPNISLPLARAEAECVMFTCIDELLSRTGVHPRDIDIVITNCSLFCPTPSLSAMIMANYGMRADVENYSLGGMGCSAGLISIKLANDLLQVKRRRLALVMSMENITQNIYVGHEKSMLVQNTLFRVGGAAMLLSNYDVPIRPRPFSTADNYSVAQHDILQQESDRGVDGADTIDCKYWFDRTVCNAVGPSQPIKYQLTNLVRCNLANDKDSFSCVYQTMDADENKGVRLDKCLMNVAGAALRRNMQILAPQVLPYSEQIKYGGVMIYKLIQKRLRTTGVGSWLPSVKEYQPNWKAAMQHYAIHAGGRAVIDAIQTGLNLTDYDTQPSRHTLSRYGNTSSSSIWYEFLYLEQAGRVKAGEKLWQVAFGSGFKCNSAVWRKVK